MAYRRSLSALSGRHLARQRFAPSFAYTHHEEDRKNAHSDEKVIKSFLQSRSFGSTNWLGFGGGTGMSFRDPKRSQFLHVTSRFLLARSMSTVSDKTMEVVSSEAAAVSEVAVAAADCWPPVAFVQHAIDGIHMYTGLNWWASIVITTLVIKTLSLPFMIRSSKSLSLTEQAKKYSYCIADPDEQIKSLHEEHGVSRLSPITAGLIKGSVFVCFYLAIQNMVEKVPSFQTGGISWFVDLTTADSFCILPYLAAFSFWFATLKHDSEGDPDADKMRHVQFLSLSALTVPFAATFPNALLCYWITSSSFSIVYELRKKLVNTPKPLQYGLSFEEALEALKKDMQMKRETEMRNKAPPSESEGDTRESVK